MDKRSERASHHSRYTDGKYAHEKMLYIVCHWEIQTETKMRYYCTPTRKAKI